VLELGDTLSRHGAVSLASFLDHLDATLDEGRFREEGDVRLPDDRIAMMTVHQAKGLEFPAVAVVGVSPPRRNSDEHFTVSPEKGIFFSEKTAARWRRQRKLAPEHDHEEKQEELEERCILYVALTRARDHLWVSTPFADGISRGRGERRSLFTDLVEMTRAKSLAMELRSVGEEKAHESTGSAHTMPDAEAEATLRTWVEHRHTAERRELSTSMPPRALEPVTWASLARFETCPLMFSFDRASLARVATDESAAAGAPPRDFPATKLPRGVDPAEFGAFVHAVLEKRTEPGAALEASLAAVAARHDFGRHTEALIDIAARENRRGYRGRSRRPVGVGAERTSVRRTHTASFRSGRHRPH
jgi:ATP-dependent exoDNAse (exonuclease V) beta subunit